MRSGLSFLILIATGIPGAAQAQKNPSPIAVTVIVAKALPGGAAALARVRPTEKPRNVVLLDLSKATPADLAVSLGAIRAINARFGDSLPGNIQMASNAAHRPPSAKSLRFAEESIASLRQAGRVKVGNLEEGQAMTVFLMPEAKSK